METNKYTYQDWIKGEITTEGLGDLVKSNQLSLIEYKKIRDEQELAYCYYIWMKLELMKVVFYTRYNNTLDKDELISLQVKEAEKDFQIFKETYPEIYLESVNGHDDRLKIMPAFLPYFFLVQDFIDDMEKDFPSHITYYIKSNFLKWLKWIERKSPTNEEPIFDTPDFKITKEISKQNNVLDKFHEEAFDFLFNKIGYKERTEVFYIEQVDQINNSFNGNTGKTNNKQGKEQVSYKWLSNPDTELPELYQRLKYNLLIHPDTTEEQLKAVFTAKPLQAIDPINWIGAKNLLPYFIDSVYPNKIHFNINQWSVAEKCFTDGKNLAQIKDKYLANKSKEHRGKPKNYQIIDDILKGL